MFISESAFYSWKSRKNLGNEKGNLQREEQMKYRKIYFREVLGYNVGFIRLTVGRLKHKSRYNFNFFVHILSES